MTAQRLSVGRLWVQMRATTCNCQAIAVCRRLVCNISSAQRVELGAEGGGHSQLSGSHRLRGLLVQHQLSTEGRVGADGGSHTQLSGRPLT